MQAARRRGYEGGSVEARGERVGLLPMRPDLDAWSSGMACTAPPSALSVASSSRSKTELSGAASRERGR